MIDLRGGLCDGGCGRDGARKAGALVLCEPCYREERAHLRAPVAAAHQRIAEIRVECGVELPQHVEPVAPVRTREVERLTLAPLPKPPEKPARAPKAVQAAADMPAVVERQERAVRTLEVDPHAPADRCRMKGCTMRPKSRGCCDSCRALARRLGRLDLMEEPRARRQLSAATQAARLRVLGIVGSTPGVGPQAMADALGMEISYVKNHLRVLKAAGSVVARDGSYSLPRARVPPTPVENRAGKVLALTAGKWLSTKEIHTAIGGTQGEVRHVLEELEKAGRLRSLSAPKLALWGGEGAPSLDPEEAVALVRRIAAATQARARTVGDLAARMSVAPVTVMLAVTCPLGKKILKQESGRVRAR